MGTKHFPCTILVFLFFALHVPVTGQEIHLPASLSALIEESVSRDRKPFSIAGEVIGEPLLEKNGLWLNISEEGNFMAVFCPENVASMAIHFPGGNHGRIGCRIRAIGILRRVCPDHGGDLDFHATTCEVTEPEKEVPDLPEPMEIILLSGLLLAILALKTRSFSSEPEKIPFPRPPNWVNGPGMPGLSGKNGPTQKIP